MDTDTFIVYIKTKDFDSDIAKDVEAGFDASIYDQIGHSLKENKKVFQLMIDNKMEKK